MCRPDIGYITYPGLFSSRNISVLYAILNSPSSSSTSTVDKVYYSYLGENHPNPFNENTTIEFYLADGVKDAKIYIYNMNGTQLKSYELHQKGNESIIIIRGEFNPGMYMYTLITDGKVIDTKRMILTE